MFNIKKQKLFCVTVVLNERDSTRVLNLTVFADSENEAKGVAFSHANKEFVNIPINRIIVMELNPEFMIAILRNNGYEISKKEIK